MTKRGLQKALNNLGDTKIQLDWNWQKETRDNLMRQISGNPGQAISLLGIFKFISLRFFTKPATVSLVLVVAVSAGLIGTIQAAQGSLPGEKLYVVKRTWEQARLNLAIREEKRTHLEVESVQKRVDELGKIVRVNNQVRNNEVLEKAVTEVQRNISTVKYRLETVKLEKPQKAAELAKFIDRHTDSYAVALKEVKKEIEKVDDEKVKAEVGKKVSLALLNVEETGIKAVSIIVEKQGQGAKVSTDQEVRESLGKKLERTKEILEDTKLKVANIEKQIRDAEVPQPNDSTSDTNKQTIEQARELVSDKAPEVIEQAKQSLEKGDLSEVVDKLVESKEIVEKIEQKIEKVAKQDDQETAQDKSADNTAIPDTNANSPINANAPVNVNQNSPINAPVNSNSNVNAPINANAPVNSNTNLNTNTPTNAPSGKVNLTPVN